MKKLKQKTKLKKEENKTSKILKKVNFFFEENLTLIMLIFGFIFVLLIVILAFNLNEIFPIDDPELETIDFSKHNILEFDDRYRGSNVASEIDFVIFTDFKCSACIQLYTTLKKLKLDYPHVNFMYKHLVSQSQDLSFYAAKAYECTRLQGKGAQLVDYMYNHNFRAIDLNREIENIGVNMQLFEECIENENISRLIVADANHGVFLEVRGTPTVFINGIKIEGVYTYDVYSAFIDREIKHERQK